MDEIPLWNQSRLPCPATSAHKIDLSKSAHLQGIMSTFLRDIVEKPQKLQDILFLVTSEVVLLKRFLYKLGAVFAHDKSYKVLKHIHKTVKKFLETEVACDLMSFQEQHTASPSSSSKVMYVAPKPKYDYILVRLQGTVRLQAQILCLCQHYGAIMTQKLQLGHFVNIMVTSMSITARLWALSLHIMHFLLDMYDSINKINSTEGLIPSSTVNFLPENYTLPLCLVTWLKSDQSLKDIYPLLERKQGNKQTNEKANIWQTINVDDDEREHLIELMGLVASTKTGESNAESELKVEDLSSSGKVQTKTTTDIGELVLRNAPIPNTKTKKKKRAKKRKGNQLEN